MARSRSTPASFTPSADMRVVLLHGKESFLMQAFTNQLVSVLETVHGEIDQFTFDGSTVEPVDVLDELRSYGLLQQHKLVILDRADEFLSGQASRRDKMERYAASPVEQATLLMRADTWRPGKLDKIIKKSGLVHKVEPPDTGRAIAWCIGRCEKRYNATIDRPAATALVDLIGPNLQRLDTELAKLASFVGSDRPVNTHDVIEMVGLSREQQAWVIQAATLSGDTAHALRTIADLLRTTRKPTDLLVPLQWALTDGVRKLHTASRMLADGIAPAAVASSLRLWGPEKERVLSLGRQLNPQILAQLLHACIESDLRSKTGRGNPLRNLEVLTVRVTDSMNSGT